MGETNAILSCCSFADRTGCSRLQQGGPADEPLPDGEDEAALPAAKPGKPKVPALADDDEEEDADAADAKPARGKPKKKGGATTTKTKKRPTYNAAAAEHWQTVPAVEVEVNSYEDEDGAVCSRDSPTCNLRAALIFVGNRQGTIKLPTVEVHKLKKGPILVPMYAHVTITSLGSAAQKKAVIYHRESSNFGGGNSAVLMVPENTTLTLDAVAFKNNPRRALYGDKGADISVLNCAFVNNTFDAEVRVLRSFA